jgi:hypothetical protein
MRKQLKIHDKFTEKLKNQQDETRNRDSNFQVPIVPIPSGKLKKFN